MAENEVLKGNAALPPEIDPGKPLPDQLSVLIVNMDKVLLEGTAKSVILPVTFGNLALLPGHTPLFTKLVKGTIAVNSAGSQPTTFDIENGVAKVTQFAVTVLVGF